MKEIHAVLRLSHSLLVHSSLIVSKPSRCSSVDELVTKPGEADKTNERQKDNQQAVDVVQDQILSARKQF